MTENGGEFSRVASACVNCRTAKVKCLDSPSNTSSCARCERLQVECKFEPRKIKAKARLHRHLQRRPPPAAGLSSGLQLAQVEAPRPPSSWNRTLLEGPVRRSTTTDGGFPFGDSTVTSGSGPQTPLHPEQGVHYSSPPLNALSSDLATLIADAFERGREDGRREMHQTLVTQMWWEGFGRGAVGAFSYRRHWTVGFKGEAANRALSDSLGHSKAPRLVLLKPDKDPSFPWCRSKLNSQDAISEALMTLALNNKDTVSNIWIRDERRTDRDLSVHLWVPNGVGPTGEGSFALFDLPAYVRYCRTDEELDAFYDGVKAQVKLFHQDCIEKDPTFNLQFDDPVEIPSALPGLRR